MKTWEEVPDGFFSARLEEVGPLGNFLKLRVPNSAFLFKVEVNYTFGNRWVDDANRLRFYDVRRMDATLSCLRYNENPGYGQSIATVDVKDVYEAPRPFRMIEV